MPCPHKATTFQCFKQRTTSRENKPAKNKKVEKNWVFGGFHARVLSIYKFENDDDDGNNVDDGGDNVDDSDGGNSDVDDDDECF